MPGIVSAPDHLEYEDSCDTERSPDEPLDLSANQALIVQIEPVDAGGKGEESVLRAVT